MKKTLIAMATIMSLAAGSVYAAGTNDDTGGDTPASKTTTITGGTIHFTGALVNTPCTVSNDSVNMTVPLGQYSLKQFKKTGDTTTRVGFNIKLNDCDTTVASKASVAFDGVPDATQKSLLAISSGGDNATSATGVGIEITDHSGTVVAPGSASFSQPHALIDGTNVLPFTARYVTTADKPTAGVADADVTFIMQYQ
ncbi:type 1 fimbrial major subunit FimA [Enterobacter cloacae]|uniref:type 1 fimbrial major subunit FimA n=1 Tax=Enterobacter cloacae TaxID=550 RepID=UPI0032D9EBFF